MRPVHITPSARRRPPRLVLIAAAAAIAAALVPTGSAVAADTCPNAAIRAKQGSEYLPGCRAYEQVSPVDKNGTDVNGSAVMRTTPDGHAIAWISAGGYADPAGLSVEAVYAAHRTGAGWATTALHPSYRGENTPGTIDLLGTRLLSDDLSRLFFLTGSPFDPGDQDAFLIFGGDDLYASDAGGVTTWISHGEGTGLGNTPFPNAQVEVAGNSGDGSTVFFTSPEALTPAVPGPALPGGRYLYRWRNGEVTAVGVDGSGAVLGGVQQLGLGETISNNAAGGSHGEAPDSMAVSRDGSRFVYAADGRTFVHRDGQPAQEILSRRAGSMGDPANVEFTAAVDDLRKIVIWSAAQLTDDTPAPPPPSDGGCQGFYYLYDEAADSLTYLTRADGVGCLFWATGLVWMSADASHVYFTSTQVLAPGATPLLRNLYLKSPSGIEFITSVAPNGNDGLYNSHNYRFTRAQATPDGHTLYFDSSEELTSAPTGGHPQIYRYEEGGALACITCRAGSTGAELSRDTGGGFPSPLAVTDSGDVYFTTTDALVNRDTNGKLDVYEYDDGHVSLISSGTSPDDSSFAGASPDGADVYFVTQAALVAQDVDGGNRDMYDARAGGGFPSPVTAKPGCSGDACQPAPKGAPADLDPTSDHPGGTGHEALPARARFAASRPTKSQLAALARGQATSLPVTVSRAGNAAITVRARIAGRTRIVASASNRASRAGSVRVRVRLSRAALVQLARRHSLSLAVTVRFTGELEAQTYRVTVSERRHMSTATGAAR